MDKEIINSFKDLYCCSEQKRQNMINDFVVTIESFEQLLPGKTIKSYASGTRDIEGAFVVFKAVSKIDEDEIYYPVFSETVGRKLAKDAGLLMPSKQVVFIENEGRGGRAGDQRYQYQYQNRKADNKAMLELIVLARSMMILHIDDPKPMFGHFKEIYDRLLSHPWYNVLKKDIKGINTAIGNFLKSSLNNEGFLNIQDYVEYLKTNYPNLHFKDYNFDDLRALLENENTDIDIYF